ncbi:DUF2867 domain-containing protein [Rhizohabitans arisaemae]|uniref:DUF2867 domain-containing protein n=1 Tax=Rhizohabitans arisaemae TaxID=2720610 RepID=UPI0024B15BC7|nr:DUF2867 domain-containing protein [Rhizohabitans arisaemae]
MIVNVHERAIPVPPQQLGDMLETLGTVRDEIWHSDLVQPIALNNGLQVGSRGGHGPVRYTVVEHTPCRFIRFRFEPGVGLVGHHWFEVVESADPESGAPRTVLRHTIKARPTLWGRISWPLLIRPIHEGAVQDMLDHIERTVTGTANRGKPTTRWARWLAPRLRRRHVTRRRIDPGPLLSSALEPTAAGDSYATPLLPSDSVDPAAWARVLLGGTTRLRRLHDALAGPAPDPATGFPVLATAEDELVLGLDLRHLSLRIGVRVVDSRVRLTTTVRAHSRAGALRWAVLRRLYPSAVRHTMATAPAVADRAGTALSR